MSTGSTPHRIDLLSGDWMSLASLIAAGLALVGAAQGARWATRAHAARSLLHQMGLTDAEIHALENVSASSSDELVPALSAHRKLAARVAAVQAALDLMGDREPDGGGVAPSSAGASDDTAKRS